MVLTDLRFLSIQDTKQILLDHWLRVLAGEPVLYGFFVGFDDVEWSYNILYSFFD